MKSILVIVKSDIESADAASLSNLAKQIEVACSKSTTPIERMNAGAYIIPWSNGAPSLNILLSAAAQRELEVQILVLDNPEWMSS